MINRSIPDYQYVFNLVTSKFNLENHGIPHTYVDYSDKPPIKDSNLVVVARNCANNSKRHQKDINEGFFIKMVRKLQEIGYEVIMLGSYDDYKYNLDIVNKTGIKFEFDDIRKHLELIHKAKFVCMNDTGLYHAAGAMRKRGLIFWKDTNPIKNLSPNTNFRHSYGFNHNQDFTEYLLDYNYA